MKNRGKKTATKKTKERKRKQTLSRSGISRTRPVPDAAGGFMTHAGQLCRKFCAYYKPGKAEDLACLGFTVIEGLIKKGLMISLEKGDSGVGRASSRALSENMCPSCPFYEDGCDFASGQASAQPCGGFLLLARLTESGTFDIDDLQNMD